MDNARETNFNSIKVQLELFPLPLMQRYDFYFNSIKVQLERKFTATTYGMIIFQFHKGTIRTQYAVNINTLACNFNSIKVQLERNGYQLMKLHHTYFNSIKVQLELSVPSSVRVLPQNFNSIKVQLERWRSWCC